MNEIRRLILCFIFSFMILFLQLISLNVRCIINLMNLNYERIIDYFTNLFLSLVVFSIIKYWLYCDYLSSWKNSSFEYCSKTSFFNFLYNLNVFNKLIKRILCIYFILFCFICLKKIIQLNYLFYIWSAFWYQRCVLFLSVQCKSCYLLLSLLVVEWKIKLRNIKSFVS